MTNLITLGFVEVSQKEALRFDCPKCGKERYYTTKGNLKTSIEKKCICKNCSNKKISLSNIGSIPWNKEKQLTEEHKRKMRLNHKGHIGCKHTEETKKKISLIHKGKIVSEEIKKKMRIRMINELKEKGITGKTRNYNPRACNFIDKLNETMGWKLQHALNGGEVELYGYFVDGYDKEKNIIFEYDEPSHNNQTQKKKDLVRQQNLIEKIKPNMFIRYNELGDLIYDVL